MSILRRDRAQAAPAPTGPASLVSSAATIQLDGKSWDAPVRTKDWQRELWRLLDLVGEFSAAASLIGSGVSRARLYMAEIGPDGDISGETKNAKAQAIIGSVLGGPHKRREEMRLLGYNLFAVGSCYITALSAGETGEEWAVLSIDDIKRKPGGKFTFDLGRGKRELTEGKDILIHCWTPHPRRRTEPNSPARSCRLPLRELEQLTKFVFAQIDSRLASAGILPWPVGTTTSQAGGSVATDLTKQLVDLAAESLEGIGTASSVVPAIVEVPVEALGKISLINFSSELSKHASDLRTEAIRRLSLGFDMAPERLLGMGDTNHWSGWYIDESDVKTHIEPILTRICEALQYGFVGPALKVAGLDPSKYQIHYDTSTLTVRPQRLKDTLDLYDKGLVSAEAVLEAGAYLDSDAPKTIEDVRRYVRELVLRDPQLFNQQPVRELIGITKEMMPPPPVDQSVLPPAGDQLTDSATPPPPPPAPEPVHGKHSRGAGEVPDTLGKQPRGSAVMALADATALRALELAGGRLLDHKTRNQHRDVPRHSIHTVVPVSADRLPALLSGAGEHVLSLAERHGVSDPAAFAAAVADYVTRTLVSGQPHDPQRLGVVMQLSGVTW